MSPLLTSEDVSRLALLGPTGWRREEQAAALHTITQQAEQIAALKRVATREVEHVNNGDCPDELEGYDVRDEDCEACRALGVTS